MMPRLSVVVIAYNMARELPRTLRSLSVPYQRGITAGDYEIIVVDNGSTEPFDRTPWLGGETRIAFVDQPAPTSSPAPAINEGLRHARGDIVCVMVDGARMASPGLLAQALTASRLDDRAIVASVAHHLGPDIQSRSIHSGYTRETEDALLAGADWENDGYRLFDICWYDGSSSEGCFGSIAESNALFMPRCLWTEIGGADEKFIIPGGGLVNLDMYARALALPGVRPVVLLGEATFHQFHGGASTNAATPQWKLYAAEYEKIRGRPYARPEVKPTYFGTIEPPAFGTLANSARLAHHKTLPRPFSARVGESSTDLAEPLLGSIQKGTFSMRYRGRAMQKSPFDLALYTQLIGRLKPTSLIEIGVRAGGSLFWFSDLLWNHGSRQPVVGVDIDPPTNINHPRIEVLMGTAANLGAALSPERLAEMPHPWLVIEDSSHLYEDSLAVLRFFHDHLRPGDYIVVEDGVVRSLGAPIYATYASGPTRAVETFLSEHPDEYEIDRTLCDMYGLNVTWNPNGWLRRL